jgi:hypothetical protein
MWRVATRSEFRVWRSSGLALARWAALFGGLCLPCNAAEPTEQPSSRTSQQLAELPPAEAAEPTAVLTKWLRDALVSEEIRDAVCDQVARSPQASSWSIRYGPRLYGIALRPLGTGEGCERTVPAMMRLTCAIAVQELMLSKAIADRFVAFGLSDGSALHEALARCSRQVNVTGRIRGLQQLAATADAVAMALVVADESAVSAELTKPQSLGDIRSAYRDVLHERIRGLMTQCDWQQALSTWEHLASQGLTAPSLCLDAARCYGKADKPADALRTLNQMLELFGETASSETLEEAGDLALDLECESAERLATRAYVAASQRLLHQVVPPDP